MIIKTYAENSAKPFIKWVGGKRQLLPALHARLPKKIGHYFEPFIGGGALLFSLNKETIQSITINDYNAELINLYQVVKNSPRDLIKAISQHKNDKTYYYRLREMDRSASYRRSDPVIKASRFIFLNKTGYNGLYRVNLKGQYNVPFGRYKNPSIIDEQNILTCSQFLQDVSILNGDFEIIKPLLSKNSFVYLDPPYAPISATSSFNSYTDKSFNDDMQFTLKNFCDYIDSLGAKFMLSNSCSPLIYHLYGVYHVNEVLANRAVNCKASGRGRITELIIRNYNNQK